MSIRLSHSAFLCTKMSVNGRTAAVWWNLFICWANLSVTFKRDSSVCGGMCFTSLSSLCRFSFPRCEVNRAGLVPLKRDGEGYAFINGLPLWWMFCCLRIRTLAPQRCRTYRETVTKRQYRNFHHSVFLHIRSSPATGMCTDVVAARCF